jgi:hypothetical protein
MVDVPVPETDNVNGVAEFATATEMVAAAIPLDWGANVTGMLNVAPGWSVTGSGGVEAPRANGPVEIETPVRVTADAAITVTAAWLVAPTSTDPKPSADPLSNVEMGEPNPITWPSPVPT